MQTDFTKDDLIALLIILYMNEDSEITSVKEEMVDLFFSFLFFSGYLTVTKLNSKLGSSEYDNNIKESLCFPNNELKSVFAKEFKIY